MGRQAKIISDVQVRQLLRFVEAETQAPTRNVVIVLLGRKAGLRSTEIGMARWSMVTDATGHVGDALALQNRASKGRSGRVIPLHADLREALATLHDAEQSKGRGRPEDFIVTLAKGATDAVTRSGSLQFLLRSWFRALGLVGCSSHSLRRTFITRAARKVSEVGGSLRDVQALAGHSSLNNTMRYIDTDPDAQRKLIDRL
jgi:integrase/recombinase XerD